MELAFITLFALTAIGYYIAARLHQKNIELSKVLVKLVCFSSLLLWVIPFAGLVVGTFTATLGKKNKHTRIGKIYWAVGSLGLLMSLAMWINNISLWIKDLS